MKMIEFVSGFFSGVIPARNCFLEKRYESGNLIGYFIRFNNKTRAGGYVITENDFNDLKEHFGFIKIVEAETTEASYNIAAGSEIYIQPDQIYLVTQQTAGPSIYKVFRTDCLVTNTGICEYFYVTEQAYNLLKKKIK